jgi:hypothetical protein
MGRRSETPGNSTLLSTLLVLDFIGRRAEPETGFIAITTGR